MQLPHKLFRFSDDYQPTSMNGTFRQLMRANQLEKSQQGQTRTLFILLHTYAKSELLKNKNDIFSLRERMIKSVEMIERHCSKLAATMYAQRLA